MSERPQAKEIMECVRILVAFIDEKQILRREEQGTVTYFRECARGVGVSDRNLHGPIPLQAQFRCAGNAQFVKILDGVLYHEGGLQPFNHPHFDVRVHDTIGKMEEYLNGKIALGYSSRLVAGFCWEWSDAQPEGTLVPDVVLDGWARPWNRKAEEGRKYAADHHPYTLWARRKAEQLGEIGCIYSTQGFEFDYIGVIWGTDLVWRRGDWVPQPANSHDRELQGNRGLDRDTAAHLLRNAYRVLCTRGMRGCSIYCQDQETRDYLRMAFGCDAVTPASP
jgi:hypothetical protein